MKTFFNHALVVVLLIVLFSSCTKQTEAPVKGTSKQLIIRIKQVEKNDKVIYSPKLRVYVSE